MDIHDVEKMILPVSFIIGGYLNRSRIARMRVNFFGAGDLIDKIYLGFMSLVFVLVVIVTSGSIAMAVVSSYGLDILYYPVFIPVTLITGYGAFLLIKRIKKTLAEKKLDQK